MMTYFVETPADTYWKTFYKVIWYLIPPRNLGLIFDETHLATPISYVDAEWAKDLTNQKFMTSCVVNMTGCAVS